MTLFSDSYIEAVIETELLRFDAPHPTVDEVREHIDFDADVPMEFAVRAAIVRCQLDAKPLEVA